MEKINDLVGKLKALIAVLITFVNDPEKSLTTLAELPAIIAGFDFSQNWKPKSFEEERLLKLTKAGPKANGNALTAYFDAHKKGRGIWKWRHYFAIYDRYFKKFIGGQVNILEIGVFSGGSLEMWRSYFGQKCRVFGVDIEKDCKAYENDYTKIYIGDQGDRKFWKYFKSKVPKIDIIIDDGGHSSKLQIATFEELIGYLAPGGIYLCEDINGTNNVFTSYLHGLVRSLNTEEGKPILGIKPKEFQRWIASIHFYPYAVVIEKYERPIKQLITQKHGTSWQPFYEKRK